MDTLSYALVMEELSKVDASASVIVSVNNSLVCFGLEAYGTEKQKEKYLIKLATGEWIGAFCLSEPEAGSDAVSLCAFKVSAVSRCCAAHPECFASGDRLPRRAVVQNRRCQSSCYGKNNEGDAAERQNVGRVRRCRSFLVRATVLRSYSSKASRAGQHQTGAVRQSQQDQDWQISLWVRSAHAFRSGFAIDLLAGHCAIPHVLLQEWTRLTAQL